MHHIPGNSLDITLYFQKLNVSASKLLKMLQDSRDKSKYLSEKKVLFGHGCRPELSEWPLTQQTALVKNTNHPSPSGGHYNIAGAFQQLVFNKNCVSKRFGH